MPPIFETEFERKAREELSRVLYSKSMNFALSTNAIQAFTSTIIGRVNPTLVMDNVHVWVARRYIMCTI